MHDFGKLVYLDMHKTGSSFVSEFLSQCCLLDEVILNKHEFLKTRKQPETFYFTTIREPEKLYISLFRFGCSGQGGMFANLSKAGHEDLYAPDAAHFNAWVRFLLVPENLAIAYPNLLIAAQLGLGLMSIRHCLYSLERPGRKFKTAQSKAEIAEIYRRQNINDFVARNETLNADLAQLSRNLHPEWFDQEKAAGFLADGPARSINKSTVGTEAQFQLEEDVRAEMLEKESLVYEQFYR